MTNQQAMEAANNAQTLITWILASYIALTIAVTGNFIASAATAIHAAKRKETAWTLVIIFFPFIGWIAYCVTGKNDNPAVQYAKGGTPGPASQPNRTAQDVANEVSAALTEEIKQRRAQRGR